MATPCHLILQCPVFGTLLYLVVYMDHDAKWSP